MLGEINSFTFMETKEFAPKEPQSVEDAARRFLDGDTNAAVSFLRAHRDEVGEFCLQIRDKYGEHDKSTPFLELARLIDSLL